MTKKKSDIFVVIVIIVIVLAIVLFGFFRNSVYDSPATLGNKNGPDCPGGTTECSTGKGKDQSRACCPSGTTCMTSHGNAWCSVDNQNSCPKGKTFCGSGNGGGKDGTCCSADQVCEEHWGFSWCATTGDTCEAKGGTICGFYCCDSNQECKKYNFGPNVCSVKAGSCFAGQELCHGDRADICCNAGQCIPSEGGAANCANNLPNPPEPPIVPGPPVVPSPPVEGRN